MDINNNNNTRTMVTIKDNADYDERTYTIMLNEKEIKFLQWLSSNCLLPEDVEYTIIKDCDADFT